MQIQFCSDLHLEFRRNNNYLKNHPLVPKANILILAGDILPFTLLDRPCSFFDDVSKSFEQVFWIPGNHEYYYSDINNFKSTFHKKIRDNVFLLNNQQVKINDVNFIFSTMWSRISESNRFNIQRCLSDFHFIHNNNKKLLADDFNQLHQTDFEFIQNCIRNNKDEKNVVVTHHVPTLMNYPEEYKNSPINEAFAVELFDFINDSNINYWIYGHHHCNIPAFKIGNTTLLTNQLGYVQKYEHRNFKQDFDFEI